MFYTIFTQLEIKRIRIYKNINLFISHYLKIILLFKEKENLFYNSFIFMNKRLNNLFLELFTKKLPLTIC